MSSRRKSRECALQMLFQWEINSYPPDEIRKAFWQQNPSDPETRRFAEDLFRLFLENQEGIDETISRHAQNWHLERMPGVDRNTMRVAVAELLSSETPRAVILDEAIEIARRFSTDDSSNFVNGVLDAIVRELQGQDGNTEEAPAPEVLAEEPG